MTENKVEKTWRTELHYFNNSCILMQCFLIQYVYFCLKVDSSKESAEAACDILSQLVNCSLKTLGLISTARPSFMDLPKVFECM